MLDANLTTFGIPPIDPHTDPEGYAAMLAVARRLRLARRQVIGFVPAEPRAAVPPLLIQLAIALSRLETVPVAIIDANARFPAFRDFAAWQAPDPEGLVTIQLDDSVELVTHRAGRDAPFNEGALTRLVERSRERFRYVLVDLTGLDQGGEGLVCFGLVDAAVLVAQARTTSEYALVVAARQVPRERQLGVLLVG